MGESNEKTIRQVGKECDLSDFKLSTEQNELIQLIRTTPDELLGIVPCEVNGTRVVCLAIAVPEEDNKGQLVPVAILVDDAAFGILTPLFDGNDKPQEDMNGE